MKSVTKKKKLTSVAWDFFKWINEGHSRHVCCCICNYKTKICPKNRSTCTMLAHIKLKHEEELKALSIDAGNKRITTECMSNDEVPHFSSEFHLKSGTPVSRCDQNLKELKNPGPKSPPKKRGRKPKVKKIVSKNKNKVLKAKLDQIKEVEKTFYEELLKCRPSARVIVHDINFGKARSTSNRGEDRKYDFGSLSSSSGGGAPFAPGLNENSTESGEGAAGGGGGGGGGGGACEEGPVPMSPEQFLCEDMEHAGGASPHTPSSSSHQRPESYKLRHNNHLTLVLESLAGDESFMDVTLTAQGKAIKAHKSVLSAVSPYFRSVLKENPCQHPIIIMPRDIRFEELNNIISYVYKGEMTVAAEDLSSMLKTAEVLQVTGLSPSEAGSGAGGIMSHMQGLPAGVFGAGAAPPAKAKKAKHVHTQQHQVVAHEEEPHAANNHDIRGRIDPLDFLNADMTCVKEEIPSDTEETEDMGFTLPDDSSGPASKVTEPLPAAASFSSDPSTTRHPSNRRKSLDSPRPMDDPSNKPFNPGEPGPSPTEPQAAAAATPSPSSTPPPPHVCPHCLETHRPTDALHSHLRLKHPSKPSFVCASCGKVFLRHSLFAEHSKKCKV